MFLCYVLYTCAHTYIIIMVHVLCIVCTVYTCGHMHVYVCICVLLYVHISTGETLVGTKLASFPTSQRKTATADDAQTC